MPKNKTFYVTTPIYYPSGRLHIGHTYCTVAADSIARYKRFTGYDVRFLTGTDEHGEKIEKTARAHGQSPIEYLDEIVGGIERLWQTMDIQNDDFIRTTEIRHKKAVQKIFQKLYDQGDIYLGQYKGWYCVPCESLWTDSQVGPEKLCPDCQRPVQAKEESSYFFRLSRYQKRLEEHFESHPDFCYPASRKKEMISNFLKEGLEDLSVSRTTFDWGIPVPFDPKHVIYVWIDALCNYLTALGYMSDDERLFEKYWPPQVQLAGKEIMRFHVLIWPALLMALDLPLPEQVFGHGWIMFSKDKMSKSKGNIVYPEPLIERYGIDALKYFLLREFTFGQDGSYTHENFLNRINADLVNDLGNLLSRSLSMIEKYREGVLPEPSALAGAHAELSQMACQMPGKVDQAMDRLQFSEALEEIWKLIRRANKYVDETMPWALAKDPHKALELDTVLYQLAESLRFAAVMISSILPDTAREIFQQLNVPEELQRFESVERFGALTPGTPVGPSRILFPRLDVEKELQIMQDLFTPQDSKASVENDHSKGQSAPDSLPSAKRQASAPSSEPMASAQETAQAKESQQTLGKPQISIDDFDKMDIRVGKVLACEKHPNADKLLVFTVEIGEETRTIVSGIAQYYDPANLAGRNVVVLCNLKPIKLRGIESRGMILSASDDQGKLAMLDAPEMPSGSEVR